MKKDSYSSTPLAGSSSFLIIFSVLCLTIFTLLSLSTVQADKRLTEHSINAVTAYYAADLEAEQILAQLRQGIIPENVISDNNLYSYSCPISDSQTLEVEVEITGSGWSVLRWQAVPVS